MSLLNYFDLVCEIYNSYPVILFEIAFIIGSA